MYKNPFQLVLSLNEDYKIVNSPTNVLQFDQTFLQVFLSCRRLFIYVESDSCATVTTT